VEPPVPNPPTPVGPDPALRRSDVYVVACPDGTAAYATGPAGPAVTPPPELLDLLYGLR
jgi:hypothetical protein